MRREAWATLDRMGHEVIEADSAADAARLAGIELPEVVLVEANLAWNGGGSLIEHFRSDVRFGRVRIVVIEQELGFDQAMAELDAGADEFLLDPIHASEIAARVHTAGRIQHLESQLDDQQAELRELIHTDPLTRLYNRRYLARQVVAQINAARRQEHALSLLLVDIDDFKAINDRDGHAAGDEALRAVARVLDERLRDTDIAGRWGGDEFLVLLPGTPADNAMLVARELADVVRGIEDFPMLTLSIGCAAWEDDDPARFVSRADLALYEVKRGGRDGVALAPPPEVEIHVASPAQARSDRPPLRVLVVDDVEGIRSLLRITLEGPAVSVVGEASDGAAAVELARRLEPDIVLMDWNMPGVDGLQGTRAVLRESPRTKVIAFTSTDDPRIQRAMREAGAVAHFNKTELKRLADFLSHLHATR